MTAELPAGWDHDGRGWVPRPGTCPRAWQADVGQPANARANNIKRQDAKHAMEDKMKRKISDTVSLVYAYGCGRPISGLDHAYAEQDRNRALWDKLVNIDELHNVSILAAASADVPALIGLRDATYHDGQRIGALIDKRAAERKAERSNLETLEFDAQIDMEATLRKAHRAEFFALLKAWRVVHPDAMKAFTERRYDAIKQARNGSGLYWGNYNRVIDSFARARDLCMKTGRRLRRSDDERTDGCLTIQIQRTASGLGAAASELFDGSFSSTQIAAQVGKQRLMDFRVDAVGNVLRIPVFWHRDMPADCRVKSAQLTWSDGGARGRRWKLCLTISRPRLEIVHQHAANAVGIDVGWRLMNDGRLRVAVWRGTDGASGELSLSPTMMQHMDWVKQTRSDIDSGKHTDERSLRRAQLYERGGRRKDMGHRREIYRLFARDMVTRYGVIGVENLHIAQLALVEGGQHAGARSQRVRAAVHVLLSELAHQAAKHGAQLIKLGGHSTAQCAACGAINAPEHPEHLNWTCSSCSATWDQDENAAINFMMSAAVHASGRMPQSDADRKINVLPRDDKLKYRTARKGVRKSTSTAVLP